MKLKPLLIDRFIDERAMKRSLQSVLDTTAKDVKKDFEKTTATWNHNPRFSIFRSRSWEREISTDSEIYGYVDEGTSPHEIRPRNRVLVFKGSYRPKTRIRTIGASSGGSSGAPVFTSKPVQHPGTEAREFSDMLQQEWGKELEERMQAVINKEVN